MYSNPNTTLNAPLKLMVDQTTIKINDYNKHFPFKLLSCVNITFSFPNGTANHKLKLGLRSICWSRVEGR